MLSVTAVTHARQSQATTGSRPPTVPINVQNKLAYAFMHNVCQSTGRKATAVVLRLVCISIMQRLISCVVVGYVQGHIT